MNASPVDADRVRAWRSGRRAERLAACMLRLKGYAILSARFKTPVGEIDLIARRGGVLAFVEVKARGDFEAAAAALTARQRHRIQRAAEAFLKTRPDLAGLDLRFDSVLIRPWSWPAHLPDAWRAD